MASSLYRLLGAQVGRGYAVAKGRPIFRDFMAAVGLITLSDDTMQVQYQPRAHHPLLIAAGMGTTDVPMPWLGNKRFRFVFGETVMVCSLFPNVGIQASGEPRPMAGAT